jgi:hypothetical protein
MKQDSWVCLLCGDSEKDLRLVLTTGDQIKRTTVLILKQGMVSWFNLPSFESPIVNRCRSTSMIPPGSFHNQLDDDVKIPDAAHLPSDYPPPTPPPLPPTSKSIAASDVKRP